MSDNEKCNLSDMEKPVKKKRRRLSIEERIKIIDRLASGCSNGRLAQEFGVSGAAISKIGKNIENYINHNQSAGTGTASRRKVMDNTAVEKAIFKWYKQKRCLNEPVPIHVFREKALEINESLNGRDTSFRAGNSWIQRFKERHNIQNFLNQKSSSLEDDISKHYCEELIQLIDEHNIHPENIYNADEMVLAWKYIPRERSLYKRKVPAINLDTITVMVCCNATGTHKLPLLIIGPEELEQSDEHPHQFIYKCQPDGVMDKDIFMKWFTEIFLPEIRERHIDDDDRCLLLIDSAPPHLPAEVLNNEDEICEVQPIHFEVTPQIQPLNQGIIRKLKATYKTTLVEELLTQNPININKFCNGLSLTKCCNYLTEAWKEISESDAKSAWQKVIVREEQQIDYYNEDKSISDLIPLLRKLPSCSRYNFYNTRDWVEEELDQPGWKVLKEEEIINEVLRDHRETIKQYENQIQNNKERKKNRKPLANNYESSIKSSMEETYKYIPKVIIKEEIDEVILDEDEIKREVEDEDMIMQQNAIFFDECGSDHLQQEEEPEQDRLKYQEPVAIISNNLENNIMINNVSTDASISSYNGKNCREETNRKNVIPSAFDAMASIDVVYKWFERKYECKQEDLIRLRQMREIARKEILVTNSKP